MGETYEDSELTMGSFEEHSQRKLYIYVYDFEQNTKMWSHSTNSILWNVCDIVN